MSDTATDLLDEPRLTEEHGVAFHVARIATPVLRDLGYRLVWVKLSGQDGPILQIMAERPDGTLDVEDCEKISDALSPALDVEDPVKSPYRLEISSPGIDRPLMRPSDFERAVGFEAKIETKELVEGRKRFRGRIDACGDGVLALTRFDAKPGEAEVLNLKVAEIADGRLVLTDDLIRETLRAAKAAREAGGLDAEDETEAPEPETPPEKGPGRFALRNAGRQPKSRPILPAGVKDSFKTRPQKPQAQMPQPNGARKPR